MRNQIVIGHAAIVHDCGRLSTAADPTGQSKARMSSFVDMAFSDRLKKAATYAKVEWSQTAVARSLGLNKQTVDRWFGKGEPKPAQIFRIADRWKVDARWLATGEEDMIPKAVSPEGLPPEEATLLANYRKAEPRWQLSLTLLAHCATDEQLEAATNVNMVLARIFGKRPKDIRPFSDKYVRSKLGDAPHVVEREKAAKKST